MKWEARGRVFEPDRSLPWMRSHAQLPVALPLGGDACRVYFASRDAENRSHVGYVDLDVVSLEILEVAREPVLAPGPLGNFDDHGVYPASLVEVDGRLFLYYIGWNPGRRSPLFYSSIGLAISDDGGRRFERVSQAPIMARGEHDPCLVTSPFVLRERDRWRMWYVSGFRWDEVDGELQSYYDVKEASSADGREWRRDGAVAIGHRGSERNIARPCVLREDESYRMWYSYDAGDGYRLGYAESDDGSRWKRLDDAPAPPRADWDAGAQAYPWVFRHRGRLHMLYNGDRFGADGFGLAVEA